MFDITKLLTQIAETGQVSFNSKDYKVKNCIAAEADGVLKMSLHIETLEGEHLKITVESVNYLDRKADSNG